MPCLALPSATATWLGSCSPARETISGRPQPWPWTRRSLAPHSAGVVPRRAVPHDRLVAAEIRDCLRRENTLSLAQLIRRALPERPVVEHSASSTKRLTQVTTARPFVPIATSGALTAARLARFAAASKRRSPARRTAAWTTFGLCDVSSHAATATPAALAPAPATRPPQRARTGVGRARAQTRRLHGGVHPAAGVPGHDHVARRAHREARVIGGERGGRRAARGPSPRRAGAGQPRPLRAGSRRRRRHLQR